jgi:enoyl-CoA hydratase/carnithine racemase
MTTIAAVDGRAHGVGNEFLVSLDMRFATNSSIFGQPEITAGIIPGAGGAQNLARLVGRGRAMEYVLSGIDITAEEADRIGWINRAFNTAAEMNTYVDQLAQRIALFPLDGITAARETINAAGVPSFQQLDQEFQSFATLAAGSESQQLLGNLLELSQNETSVPFFLDLGKNILEIYGKQPSGK